MYLTNRVNQFGKKMNIDIEYRGKAKLFVQCKEKGLPIRNDDKMECLELIYSLALANEWNYMGTGSAEDRIIERTIQKIRNFIEYGYYSVTL